MGKGAELERLALPVVLSRHQIQAGRLAGLGAVGELVGIGQARVAPEVILHSRAVILERGAETEALQKPAIFRRDGLEAIAVAQHLPAARVLELPLETSQLLARLWRP